MPAEPERTIQRRTTHRREAGGTAQRRALFSLAVVVAVGLLVWLLSSILLPFVIGMAIGYFLNPLVNRLEARGVSRAVAAGALIIGFFAIAALVLVLVVPLIVEQGTMLVQRVPDLVAWARETALPWVNRLAARLGVRGPVAQPSPEIMQRLAGVASGLLSGGLALVNVVALLAITPIVAFYLLRDWPKVIADVDDALPLDYRDTIREQARRIDGVLAGFARGAAIVCLALAAFYGVALSLAGLEFGLLIGIAAGLVSFIPYVGATSGFAASVGVALYQFWPDWVRVAIVGGIFLVGQVLQDYVLSPRLIGDQVGLHPLWLIFGVLAGGALFGFVGVLLAVPVCAVIGVLVRFALERYKQSHVYLGEE